MFSAAAGQTEHSTAMRTLVIDVCAAVTNAVAQELEKIKKFFSNSQKRIIFTAPRRNVARKASVEHPDNIGGHQHGEERPSRDDLKNQQHDVSNQKCRAELIVAVTTIHKLQKLLLEFFHNKTLSGESLLITP